MDASGITVDGRARLTVNQALEQVLVDLGCDRRYRVMLELMQGTNCDADLISLEGRAQTLGVRELYARPTSIGRVLQRDVGRRVATFYWEVIRKIVYRAVTRFSATSRMMLGEEQEVIYSVPSPNPVPTPDCSIRYHAIRIAPAGNKVCA